MVFAMLCEDVEGTHPIMLQDSRRNVVIRVFTDPTGRKITGV